MPGTPRRHHNHSYTWSNISDTQLAAWVVVKRTTKMQQVNYDSIHSSVEIMKANAAAMPERETTLLKRLEFVRWILEIASHTVASHKSKSLGLKSKSKSESLVFKSESKSKSPKTVLESDSSPSTWLEYYNSGVYTFTCKWSNWVDFSCVGRYVAGTWKNCTL